MAVENEFSTQYTNAYLTSPASNLATHEMHGRLRIAYFNHSQETAGDATSDVVLCKLPAGNVRLILPLSQAYVNWTTASATLDLGWSAYTDIDGNAVVADPNGLDDGIDVETAGYFTFGSTSLAAIDATGGTKLFSSQGGVNIIATSQDVALAASSTIAGYLVFVLD